MGRIASEELSVFELNITTSNAAESCHSKLKSIVKIIHPRIWTFMSTLNEVIQDTDNDIGRLRLGKEISRPRKKKDVKNYDRRRVYKQKLIDGNLTPCQYLQAISNTIGNIYTDINNPLSNSESSGDETSEDTTVENSCVVCLFTHNYLAISAM